jgi:formate dehydrogenase major subunit
LSITTGVAATAVPLFPAASPPRVEVVHVSQVWIWPLVSQTVRAMTDPLLQVPRSGYGRRVQDRSAADRLPPLLRQLRDPLGLARAAQSRRSRDLVPRTRTADKVVRSVCPYCAVGCGQRVFVKDEKVVQIEGDPDSPISRGRLCPKGAASEQYVNSALRETRVKYRRPGGTTWESLDLDTAMDMIADRVIATRRETWEDSDSMGRPLNRTRGFGLLGGATLDSEENYLIKKFFTAMGAIQIENQARI